jgi:hypothetical protein
MPLRDHFRPPASREESWEAVHGMWPAVIVQQLRRQLPPGYSSAPKVHMGPYIEVDIGAFETDQADGGGPLLIYDSDDGTATATWAMAQPSVAVETDIPEEAEYEVKVYDVERDRTLVAVIELVSPAHKDRKENRKKFITKCASLLQQGLAVTIVDIVTVRSANLYTSLLEFLGHTDTTMTDDPAIYTASLRWAIGTRKAKRESWSNRLSVGAALPSIPIWLSPQQVITFDLNASYDQVCEDLNFSG